jgi:hypothetical protein
VDVELELVEECVVDFGDGAVDLLLDAEKELQRSAGFVARGEGDVGELVGGGVGDVFACVAGVDVRDFGWRDMFDRILHGSVQAADGDALADFVARQDERILCGACESGVERDKKTDNERQLIEHGADYRPNIISYDWRYLSKFKVLRALRLLATLPHPCLHSMASTPATTPRCSTGQEVSILASRRFAYIRSQHYDRSLCLMKSSPDNPGCRTAHPHVLKSEPKLRPYL